jgi:predicted DNA-binding transcriptional regulator YafY
VQEIKGYLEECGDASTNVSLRNVQRDLKDLVEIATCCVGCVRENKQLHYFIEPDMRNKLTLPIQQNNLLAFFLLKRLQPFFAQKAKTIEQLTETITDLAGEADYGLFDDLDEKFEESTFLYGGESSLSLDDHLFNNLITSLIKRQKLIIQYLKPADETPRRMIICPLKLILFKGELFFSCLPDEGKPWNFYIKLCRIMKAELSRETFTPDPERLKKFDARLSTSFGLLDPAGEKPQRIIIKFPPDEYYKKIFAERRFHKSQLISKDKKGNTILTLDVAIGSDLLNWVLCWPDAEVLEPARLKRELREMGKMLVKRYK